MNKRSLTLIMATAVLVLCLLSPFAGAVTISYTADSGGESVSINENYDIDNTVTVKETTDISFSNLQVDQERTAEGTGEADLEQTITGKTADGTQYTAENVILSEGTIYAKTYTSATGNTLGVAQTVSATGDAELHLEGEEGDNMAVNAVAVENGRLNSKQILDIGHSVRASLDTNIQGVSGHVSSYAEYADGNWAGTWVRMNNGELSTKQEAEADGSATTGQVSDVDAEWGHARSWAEDADGNLADTWVRMENGELSTVQGAEADGSATADQVSDVDADSGVTFSRAEDADGNLASTLVIMENGELSTVQGAEADGSATADQVSDVDADSGGARSGAEDADGNLAWTWVHMENGELSTKQGAEADGSATAAEKSRANGTFSMLTTSAENQYGETNIENRVVDGTLDSESEAIANEDEAFCSQDMSAEGSYIYKFVEADNFAGPYASDTTKVWAGTLTAISTATVNVTSAQVTDSLSAEGLVINKFTYAESWVGYTEIDLEVDNGTLNGEFLGKASDAEAFCSQDMNFTGDLDEWIEVYNVVMSAGGWAHIWSTVPIEDPVDLWSNATVNETNTMINIGVGISP